MEIQECQSVTNRLHIELHNKQQAWAAIKAQLYPFLAGALQGGKKWILTIKPETRTQAQNRLMWPILEAFAKQLEWPVNGRMVLMGPEDWKDLLSAAFSREQVRLAMGLDGSVVLLGQRTSQFTKTEFGEWVEFLYSTATDRGVSLPDWVGTKT